MRIRSLLKKVSPLKRAPTLERAEEAYSKGRKADAAAIFRALAEDVWHEVFSDISPRSFTQTGYTEEASGGLKKVLTIHAVRVR